MLTIANTPASVSCCPSQLSFSQKWEHCVWYYGGSAPHNHTDEFVSSVSSPHVELAAEDFVRCTGKDQDQHSFRQKHSMDSACVHSYRTHRQGQCCLRSDVRVRVFVRFCRGFTVSLANWFSNRTLRTIAGVPRALQDGPSGSCGGGTLIGTKHKLHNKTG